MNKSVAEWLKKAVDVYENLDSKKKKTYVFQPGGIVTITKDSLRYPKEIVDEYIKWGLEVVFLRPLAPLGVAEKTWSQIGYSADDFLKFYKKALDYIILKYKQGVKIQEKLATYFLVKILTDQDGNYLELCSPCGAGIGQLAYNYDGRIFTCDEGRMLSNVGDDIFLLGDVNKGSFKEMIKNPSFRTMCLASELNGQPACANCVYHPYCGICPIFNYATQKNLFGQMATNFRCEIYKKILDLFFLYLKDKNKEKIFKNWVDRELSSRSGPVE